MRRLGFLTGFTTVARLMVQTLQRKRLLDGLQVFRGVFAQVAVETFPDAQQKEGNYGRGGPELGLARGFGFRLPAEELRSDDKRDQRAADQRRKVRSELGHARMVDHRSLQAADKIRRREEDSDFLKHHRQLRKWNRGP